VQNISYEDEEEGVNEEEVKNGEGLEGAVEEEMQEMQDELQGLDLPVVIAKARI
jgi:hypothetical protein